VQFAWLGKREFFQQLGFRLFGDPKVKEACTFASSPAGAADWKAGNGQIAGSRRSDF